MKEVKIHENRIDNKDSVDNLQGSTNETVSVDEILSEQSGYIVKQNKTIETKAVVGSARENPIDNSNRINNFDQQSEAVNIGFVQESSTGNTTKRDSVFLKNLLVDISIAAVLACIILFFVQPTVIRQTSMQNTLQPNDYVIVYRRAYSGDKIPQRGDIVVFQSSLVNEETGDQKLLVKRVIGLPGDEICIVNNQLYINGKKYNEDYLKDGITPSKDIPEEGETFVVPEEQYYCMGDNRIVSLDSRYSTVGCVTKEMIKGKAVLRLFPFNKIQRF